MDKFENKLMHFVTALTDVYRDEEEKESTALTPLEFSEEELTEDFTAMIYAMWECTAISQKKILTCLVLRIS